MEQTKGERRRHSRWRIDGHDAPMIYRRLGPNKVGRIPNLSVGGLMAEFPERFPPGTALNLLIPLGEKSIRAKAEVRWSKETPDTGGDAYRHGLKFTRLELHDRLTLRLFIAEISRRCGP